MTLVELVVVLIVIGLVLWLLQSYILPHMPEPIRTIIVIVIVLVICLLLLSWVGIIAHPGIRLG